MYLSVCLSACLPFCLSLCVSVYIFVRVSVCVSVFFSLSLSLSLCACLFMFVVQDLHEETSGHTSPKIQVIVHTVEVSADKGQSQFPHYSSQLLPHTISRLKGTKIDKIIKAPFFRLI